MGKGGSKNTVRESAAERAEAQVGRARFKHYVSNYRPVEQNFIEESGKDISSTLAGRANADVSQAGSSSLADAVALGRGTISELGETAKNWGGAMMEGVSSAVKDAQIAKDTMQTGATAIGNDLATDVTGTFSSLARSANSEAVARAKAQQDSNDAKWQALGQIAGGAVRGKMHRDDMKEMQSYKDKMSVHRAAPDNKVMQDQSPYKPSGRSTFTSSLLGKYRS